LKEDNAKREGNRENMERIADRLNDIPRLLRGTTVYSSKWKEKNRKREIKRERESVCVCKREGGGG